MDSVVISISFLNNFAIRRCNPPNGKMQEAVLLSFYPGGGPVGKGGLKPGGIGGLK